MTLDSIARAAKCGDDAALAQLIAEFEPRAWKLARRCSRDIAIQEELISVARAALWQALRSWQPERGPAMPYLYLAASQAVSREAFRLGTAVGGSRRHQRAIAKGDMPDPEMVRGTDGTEHTVSSTEDAVLDRLSTLALLEGISPRDQRLITWRYGLDGREERTFEEIGQRLGVAPSTAMRQLNAAMRSLRESAGMGHAKTEGPAIDAA